MAGHLWAPTPPRYPHCIVSTLGWDTIDPSVSPLDSEPVGVWNAPFTLDSLTMQRPAGTRRAYRVK